MGTPKVTAVNILAVIGEVNAQIHEVVFTPAGLVNNFLEHSLVDLVGNIAQHDLNAEVSSSTGGLCWGRWTHCRTNINALSNAIDVDLVVVAASDVVGRSVHTHRILATTVRASIRSQSPRAHVVALHCHRR